MDSKTETVSDNDYARLHRNLFKKYGITPNPSQQLNKRYENTGREQRQGTHYSM